MAERLTECIDSHLLDNGEMVKEYSLNSKIELNHFSCMDIPNAVYDKLGELEDILEKYGVDIQNLDYILEDYSKNQGRDFAICEERDTLRQERDTWQKACEFLAYKYAEEYFDGRDIEHCFNANKRDKFVKENINYFYQQIKELSNNTFKCEICGEITPKECEGGEPNVCADCVPT